MIRATIRGCTVDAEMNGTARTLANEISMITVVATQRLAAVMNIDPAVLLKSVVSSATRNINCKVIGSCIAIETLPIKEGATQ